MGSVRERAVPTLAAVGVSGPASMECARLGSVCVEVFERLGTGPGTSVVSADRLVAGAKPAMTTAESSM